MKNNEVGNGWSVDAYSRAFGFAAEAHKNQRVPGSTLPYVTHVALVSVEVIAAVERHHDGNLAIQAALLHDVLEDTSVTYGELSNHFGSDVAKGVQALTKNKALSKAFQLQDSLKRIRAQPQEIWLVKLADRITNLREPPAHWQTTRKVTYQEAAILIDNELGAASTQLSERLRKKIREYSAFL